MKQLIVKNFWLKVTALFLAIVIWLYVVGELNKGTPEEKSLFERILPARVSAKEVPIKVVLIGKPVPGYTVLTEEISVKPYTAVVLAPRNLLKNIGYMATEEIDIGEFTKSTVKDVGIKPVGPGIVFDKDFRVRVVIPVKKIKPEEEK